MSIQNAIVSLDIGTSLIKIVIGEYKNGSINIVGVGRAPSKGINNGAIIDIEETVSAIKNALNSAKQMVDIEIDEVFVSVNSSGISLVPSRGTVAVTNPEKEITDEDVDRVIQAAKIISVPPEQIIIDVIPHEFIVDSLTGVNDPRGMLGVRLEVNATIVLASKTIIHNIHKCIEGAGLRVAKFILSSMAAGSLSLKTDEKELGAILLDIGAGGVNISIFDKGRLVQTSLIPIGGNYITKDIAYGLKTGMEDAEEIKIKYGCGLISLADEEETFVVNRIGTDRESEYTQEQLAAVIQPRLEEMFQHVLNEIKRMGYDNDITSGFFITGGVANLQYIAELAATELNASVQVVMPNYFGAKDSSFTTGVGVIKYVTDHKLYKFNPEIKNVKKINKSQGKNFFKNLVDQIKELV